MSPIFASCVYLFIKFGWIFNGLMVNLIVEFNDEVMGSVKLIVCRWGQCCSALSLPPQFTNLYLYDYSVSFLPLFPLPPPLHAVGAGCDWPGDILLIGVPADLVGDRCPGHVCARTRVTIPVRGTRLDLWDIHRCIYTPPLCCRKDGFGSYRILTHRNIKSGWYFWLKGQ